MDGHIWSHFASEDSPAGVSHSFIPITLELLQQGSFRVGFDHLQRPLISWIYCCPWANHIEFKGIQRTYIFDSVGRWKIMIIYEHTIHWLTFIKTSPSKVFTLEFLIFLLVFCSGPSSCFRTVRNAPRSQTTTLVSFLGNELQTSCRTRAAASNPQHILPSNSDGTRDKLNGSHSTNSWESQD